MKKFLISIIIILVLIFGIVTGFYLTQKKVETTTTPDETPISDNTDTVSSNDNSDITVILDKNSSKISEEDYNKDLYKGIFELPLNGATAYASVSLPLYKKIPSTEVTEEPTSEPSTENIISTLKPGSAFKVLQESSDWFYVELSNSTKGWIESKYCLVNLPDLIPSIIYDDTNSYKSIFRSSGYDLEGVTGKALYNAKKYNKRLEKDEYIMPLLYPMVKKIAEVQKQALKNGDSLKIYETFRPYEAQMKVSNSLSALMEANEEVSLGIISNPWNKGWFIATQLSNHQRGVALDVSLAKIEDKEYKYCGSYAYFTVSKHEEYKMPTQMHELSKAAATFTTPVNSKSKTAWKSASLAPSMTSGAIKLQNYFTSFGLTPLASEWWHFNDLDTRELTKDKGSNGKFYLTEILSEIPKK